MTVLMKDELRALLNKYSAENVSNTPDTILTDLLLDALRAFNDAVNARSRWYGRIDKPGQPGDAAHYEERIRMLEEQCEKYQTALEKGPGYCDPQYASQLQRINEELRAALASARADANAAWKRRSEWQEAELERLRAEYDQRFVDLYDRVKEAEKGRIKAEVADSKLRAVVAREVSRHNPPDGRCDCDQCTRFREALGEK